VEQAEQQEQKKRADGRVKPVAPCDVFRAPGHQGQAPQVCRQRRQVLQKPFSLLVLVPLPALALAPGPRSSCRALPI